MSPRLVGMYPVVPGVTERQARINEVHAQMAAAVPQSVRDLVKALMRTVTHAHVLGLSGQRYREVEPQIPVFWRVRFPISPEEAVREANEWARKDGRGWDRRQRSDAVKAWRTARSTMAEVAVLEGACIHALDKLIESLPLVEEAIREARSDLNAIVPSVPHWLTEQKNAWAPVRQCLYPTLSRAPWKFDYDRALPGIRAMEATVAFLVNADYELKPKKRKARKRPPAQADRPLTLIETRTLEVVGRHGGNIAAAAREMHREPKTVRENYTRAMEKMNRLTKGTSRSVSAGGLPTDRRGQTQLSDDGL